MASFYAAVLLLLLLRFSCGAVAVSSSYISRTTEQQIIASAAPAAFADADADDQSDLEGLPFLASPSGSFAAYLRRATTVDNVGDVCYVEVVQQQGGGGGTSSVWESECTPVSGADTCDLAFSPVGLELFAGGHSLWDTAVDSDPEMVSLDGAGDMRIVSRDGVTVWRTRDEPWTGQRCGAPLPVSSSASTVDVLPPPKATTGAKLLTPPAVTSALASPWGSDFSFGDQTAPPFDTEPDQMLPPPPPAADDEGSTDLPDLPLPPPPPPADPSTYWPDLPLPPPPADTYPIPIPETPEVSRFGSLPHESTLAAEASRFSGALFGDQIRHLLLTTRCCHCEGAGCGIFPFVVSHATVVYSLVRIYLLLLKNVGSSVVLGGKQLAPLLTLSFWFQLSTACLVNAY
jgi:hypothetical protein